MIVDIGYLKLSAQRGLLYNVFPELRAVCASAEENLIYMAFFIDGEITEEQRECCASVLDDVLADFFQVNPNEKDDLEYEAPIIRLDYPQKPPLRGFWVYYRYESHLN